MATLATVPSVRICVLQSAFATPFDNYLKTPARFLPGHVCEHHFIDKPTAVEQVSALIRRGDYDVFVNLCDGESDDDEAGIEVVHTLQRHGVPFTGGDHRFYEPTRAEQKHAARACGILAPRDVQARDLDAVDRADRTLRYPMMVKHYKSQGSIGTTRGSRVTDRQQLHAEVARFVDAYGGALIEEFIEGPEYTVLVAEDPTAPGQPLAFLPVQANFPAGETFKHFDLKFVGYDAIVWTPVDDLVLAERLKDMSRRFFVAMRGRSYGRCDIRMDPEGRLYMLEINANCGIFYPPGEAGSADMILEFDPRGHRGFLDLILAAALRRARRPLAEPRAADLHAP